MVLSITFMKSLKFKLSLSYVSILINIRSAEQGYPSLVGSLLYILGKAYGTGLFPFCLCMKVF